MITKPDNDPASMMDRLTVQIQRTCEMVDLMDQEAEKLCETVRLIEEETRKLKQRSLNETALSFSHQRDPRIPSCGR